MPRGGVRDQSAIKKTVKYANEIGKFVEQAAGRMDRSFANMAHLADGGYERVREKWMPAGLVLMDQTEVTEQGKVITRKVLAYPNLPPDEMVLVERTSEIADKDRQANEYLVNCIAGPPASEMDLALSEERAKLIRSQLRSGLPKAQVENLQSQTEFNKEQTALSKASLVTEELFQKGIQQISAEAIGYFQRIPRVDLLKMMETEEGYYAMQTNLTAIMEAASKRVLAIEAGPDDEL